jgi:hypothetical protein
MEAGGISGHWTCSRKADFSVRGWPDGVVLFDDASGQLYCLTPVAGEAMALILASDSQTTGELAETLLGEVPSHSDSEMMENMLLSLESMNLIVRHSTASTVTHLWAD